MKQFKVRIKLKTSGFTIETIVFANSSYYVGEVLKGQYGSNLQSFGAPQEVK